MSASRARVISYPEENKGQEQINREDLSQQRDFLEDLATGQESLQSARSRLNACLAEVATLKSEQKWQQVLDLFYPLEDKEPQLVAQGLDGRLRQELAFALTRLKRFDEALQEYEVCLKSEPGNFHCVSGMAYALYSCLYAAKNKERIMPGKQKAEFMDRAHAYFAQAQELRPEGVTSYYRQGMLYKNLQDKDRKAAPLFRKAVENWEAYDEQLREQRHQEFKNYVKSLYNLASCLLKQDRPKQALENLNKCLEQDRDRDYLKPEHKHFALGKIHYQLGRLEDAVQDLEFAVSFVEPAAGDYILELWARVELARKDPAQALQVLARIPQKARRHFVRWTEGDIHAALGDYEQARQVWKSTLSRDRRSKHKALLRLARLEFRFKNYEAALKQAQEADSFHHETFNTPCRDALFWIAASYIRLGRRQQAEETISELEAHDPEYPLLGRLRQVFAQSFA